MKKINTVEVTQKEEWEAYVSSREEANFLSSWNWGDFHKRLDKQVFYRGYYQNKTLLGVSLLVKETAKRGKYLTIAGGPLLDWKNQELIRAWVEDINSIAKREKCLFVRVRPQILDTPEHRHLFSSYRFKPSPMHVTADLTLQLDLKQSQETLLAQMRKSTRYEIKKAEKLGIVVKTSSDPDEINQFYEHQLFLAKKHGFIPFGKKFLKTQFEIFSNENQALLFHSYDNQAGLLATAFIIMYGNEAVYHYGISTDKNRRLPGSYACQWAAIKEAKKRGIERYNFWGIAPQEASNDHRFSGVSLFKRGFGGQEVAYLPAHDLATSAFYPFIKAFETFRAKKRNLD